MAYEVCPIDKKKKSDVVCKHRHYKEGKYKPCEHYKGAGCAHPKKYVEEKK
jgi:hypothetical protein